MQLDNIIISVILATKNEERNIGRCIKSIQEQNNNNYEIIVVDNQSEDDTIKIASELIGEENVYNLANELDLTEIRNYRGAQVNFGISKSNGKIIFFPDADMTFDKELFNEVLEKFNVFDAFYVPELVLGKDMFGKIRNFERSFYNMTCIDTPRFVLKDKLMKINGFDEKNIKFGFDDWDLTMKLEKISAKFSITANKIYHHEENLEFSTYISKKVNYVADASYYIDFWGKDNLIIKKQFGIWYRFFGVFMENGKWTRLLRHPLLTLGMYYLRFRVGISFLTRRKRGRIENIYKAKKEK